MPFPSLSSLALGAKPLEPFGKGSNALKAGTPDAGPTGPTAQGECLGTNAGAAVRSAPGRGRAEGRRYTQVGRKGKVDQEEREGPPVWMSSASRTASVTPSRIWEGVAVAERGDWRCFCNFPSSNSRFRVKSRWRNAGSSRACASSASVTGANEFIRSGKRTKPSKQVAKLIEITVPWLSVCYLP